MLQISARLAAQATPVAAESSKTAPADSMGDELAKIKAFVASFSTECMAQIDIIKAHFDTAIQTAETSILETVQADLQAAASTGQCPHHTEHRPN